MKQDDEDNLRRDIQEGRDQLALRAVVSADGGQGAACGSPSYARCSTEPVRWAARRAANRGDRAV